jgi:uncharacterized short protein YbdD (DUF466 family)
MTNPSLPDDRATPAAGVAPRIRSEDAAPPPTLRARWAEAARCLCQGARLMVGVPDYDTYLAHLRRTHPDQTPMTYAAFFQERQAARYGAGRGGGFRCC